MKSDPLGDKVKALEDVANSDAFPLNSFLLARVDGRAFHTFTNGMQKPADASLLDAMIAGTIAVAEDMKVRLAYVQSDEATFCWHYPSSLVGVLPFNGRKQKLCSLIAAGFTAAFMDSLSHKWVWSKAPSFDCRIWTVPSFTDQYEAFLWREKDAVKNAVSSAASTVATSKELDGMRHRERLELLTARGFDFDKLPSAFKHGAYVRRQSRWAELDEATLERIPAAKRPAPGHLFERHDVKVDERLRSIRQLDNLAEFFVNGAEPVLRAYEGFTSRAE